MAFFHFLFVFSLTLQIKNDYGRRRKSGGGRPQRAERADRRINAGHSRGLDAALAKTEASIRTLKTERIYAFDKNGKEIAHSTTGSINGTALPSGYSYKDAILTHNHPGKGLGDNIAGRIGRSFSGTDIGTAVMQNAAEIRAVTGNYTYSIKRPKNGWGISNLKGANKVAKEITRKHYTYYTRYSAQARADYYNGRIGANQAKASYNRADVGGVNRALREVAKKYGWDYTRKRTS